MWRLHQRSTRRSYATHWQKIRVRKISLMIASLVASEWRITAGICLEHWINWAQLASRWTARSEHFACQDLRSLGMTSVREAWLPARKTVAAVMNAGAPKDAAEVRSFLGLVQYWSKFLPDYALLAEPLRELTRKNVKFRWGVKQQEAFAKLKEMITERRSLVYFRNDCRTRIVADAGTHGLGTILTQQQDGVWRVVCGVVSVKVRDGS